MFFREKVKGRKGRAKREAIVCVASVCCVQPVRVNPHRCAAADEDPWSVESQLMRAKSQIEALEHQLSTQLHRVLRATVPAK